MKCQIYALLVLLCASSAYARTAEEVCPLLPPNSGFVWSYKEGPDFDLCYALDAKSKVDAFGIYIGSWPQFHPNEKNRISTGRFAGRVVTWYSDQDKSEFGRQTLILLGKEHGLVAHAWIGAQSAVELKRSLEVLENVAFKNNAF